MRCRFERVAAWAPTVITLNSVAGTLGSGRTLMQYRVHEFPVNESHADGRCSLGSIGRRWNPRQVDPNACFPPALSKCEMGDLSGKFGPLLSNVFVAQRFIDPTLSLLGPSGIIGRSLAIYDDQGQPSVCATIVCTSGCPPSSLKSAPAAAQCSSESCPDRTMPWSSPLSGGCYATQLRDYYVKCDGKKAALQASVTNADGTITSFWTSAPVSASVAPASIGLTAATQVPTYQQQAAMLPSAKVASAGLRSAQKAPFLGVLMLVVAFLA